MLRTYVINLETTSENLQSFTNLRPESPVITLTFTYNLNNYQQRAQDEDAMDLNFIR